MSVQISQAYPLSTKPHDFIYCKLCLMLSILYTVKITIITAMIHTTLYIGT